MDFLGAIGTAARGLNAYNDEDERLRKAAFDEADAAIARAKKKYEGLQEAGKGLMAAGRNQEASALIPGVRSAFNEAYGQNLPTPPKTVGEPVMARGQEMVKGKMMATPYTYDTGKRDFNNPRTAAGVRAGLMLGAPKLDDRDPYRELYNTETGGVVRAAKDNPYKMTAEVQEELRRLGYSTSAANNQRNNETRVYVVGQQEGGRDRRFYYGEEGRDRRFYAGEEGKDRRQITAADIAADRRQKALEDKEITERAKAAAIVARYVTGKLGGKAKVIPATADIEFDGLYPMTDKQRRMLENAATEVGGFFYEEPGKKPRIIMNPGSTAASLRDKIKEPGLIEGEGGTLVKKVEGAKVKPTLVTDKTTGRRVRDGEGVTVDEPAEAKREAANKRHRDALLVRARGMALSEALANARNNMADVDTGYVDRRTREIYQGLLMDEEPGGASGAAPVDEDPAAELLRMMREEREARKKK